MRIAALRLYRSDGSGGKYPLIHFPPEKRTRKDKKSGELKPTLSPSEWLFYKLDIDCYVDGAKSIWKLEVPLYSPYPFFRYPELHALSMKRYGPFLQYWRETLDGAIDWNAFMEKPQLSEWFVGPIRGKADKSTVFPALPGKGEPRYWALMHRKFEEVEVVSRTGAKCLRQQDTSYKVIIIDRFEPLFSSDPLIWMRGQGKQFWTYISEDYDIKGNAFHSDPKLTRILNARRPPPVADPLSA